MRDPLALGFLTGAGFIPASKNVEDEFKGLVVREITFKSLSSNESGAWIGYEDMDPVTGFEVLDHIEPGEAYVVSRPSTDRLLRLSDYGALLENPSEIVLVTARID